MDAKSALTTRFRRFSTLVAFVALPTLVGLTACGAEDAEVAGNNNNNRAGAGASGGASAEGGQGGGSEEEKPQICLIKNCRADDDCSSCGDNRNTCLKDEKRCVACDSETGEGCAEGLSCSEFGICAPSGQVCKTDNHGNPTVECTSDNDCASCSPQNQVCDTLSGKCQACTPSNREHCGNADICLEGRCSSKCPSGCGTDSDCGYCGTAENPAHACNAHKCSECSDTYPCAAGKSCLKGTCVETCGIAASKVSGDCVADQDCWHCGDGKNEGEPWACTKAINAGPNDHGTCGVPAKGCSDLGSFGVLPEPWNKVTNLCEDDASCKGVGIEYNVGKALRDLVGGDKLNLGITKVKIHDANIEYGMNRCADVDIAGKLTCGVCVPCKIDSDCSPIEIDPLIGKLFKSAPYISIAASFLFDFLWGDEVDHDLNFFCQPVAGGYGVCAPCGNPLQPCGEGLGTKDTGTCSHSTCKEGGPLNTSCGSCEAAVCDADPYCCEGAWDSTCLEEVGIICGTSECGTKNGSKGACGHDVCDPGYALDPNCHQCADDVCYDDPYCCENDWDETCTYEVFSLCEIGTCSPNGVSSCEHGACAEGKKMTKSCSTCATDVCNEDDYCCTDEWDGECVRIAETTSSCGC